MVSAGECEWSPLQRVPELDLDDPCCAPRSYQVTMGSMCRESEVDRVVCPWLEGGNPHMMKLGRALQLRSSLLSWLDYNVNIES